MPGCRMGLEVSAMMDRREALRRMLLASGAVLIGGDRAVAQLAGAPPWVKRYRGPADAPHYEIVRHLGERGISVRNGVVIGDRATHRPRRDGIKTDEFGHGIYIANCDGGVVQGVEVRDCWGDGIVVGFSHPRTGKPLGVTRNLALRDIKVQNCRRNAVSFIGAENIVMEDFQLRNTHGTHPGAGIDFEPDNGARYPNRNITLRRGVVEGNQNFGILCDDSGRASSYTSNVVMEDVTIRAGRDAWALWLRFAPGNNVLRRCKIYGPVAHLANVTLEDCEFFHDGSYSQSPFAVDVNNNDPVRFVRPRFHARTRILGRNKRMD